MLTLTLNDAHKQGGGGNSWDTSIDLWQDTGWFGKHRAKVACTYQSLAFNFDKTCSLEIETNDSMTILLFPSSVSISNQSIVNQNCFENEDLVSTVNSISGKVYSLDLWRHPRYDVTLHMATVTSRARALYKSLLEHPSCPIPWQLMPL